MSDFHRGYMQGFKDACLQEQGVSVEQSVSVGEPVAWRISYPNEPELGFWLAEGIGGEGCLNEPLYTTPQQRTAAEGEDTHRAWVGLTDDDVREILLTTNANTYVGAIEAKLKEKNT